MKRLQDLQTLAGETETITLSELRKQPGDVFQQVAMGKRFTITKSGKTVATICPAKPVAFIEPTSNDADAIKPVKPKRTKT